MKLTNEQLAIINTKGDIKINAVAGSGKTTTVIEYAKSRPKDARILYIAFNRSVRIEAERKFAEAGLHNVKVETAHSLAYKNIVYRYNYRVKNQGYNTSEIVSLLGLKASGEKHAEYIIANHINKFVALFCNSDKQKVSEVNYLETITEAKAKKFVQMFYKYIEKEVRLFLAKMDSGQYEITHDFYLKKFQLSQPILPYDYILFDEGQDASAAMLAIFLQQDAVKVIVGDTHQQIYGWRYAVNSLEKVNFNTLHLSTSFRFGNDLAYLATNVLGWKNHLGTHTQPPIKGIGTSEQHVSKAIIARTNLGLLLKAIEYTIDKKEVGSIYFEGNINSYTYADDGTSLYDVLNLSNGKIYQIKDPLIKTMRGLPDLEEYIKQTEEVQLGMMVEIVKKYGSQIPNILKTIKEKHVDDNDKSKAKVIFSTVHRCKGMEYDIVELVDDFMSEEKLEKLSKDPKERALSKTKLNEEINLLYVGITRAKNTLHIPVSLLPKDYQPSKNIVVIHPPEKTENESPQVINAFQKELKAKPISKKTPAAANQPWTPALDQELIELYDSGASISQIANQFGRTYGAIRSRIKKLVLEEDNW